MQYKICTARLLLLTSCEVATLAHEARDDPVECRSLVSESLLSSAQRPEVLGSLRDHVVSQLHHNSTSSLATNGDIKERIYDHFV